MNKLNLSTPWVNYYHKLEAFFKEDRAVTVEYNNEDPSITLYVTGEAKAAALEELLPDKLEFGSVILTITVIPSNVTQSKSGLLINALEGNKAFSFTETIQGPMSNPMTFIVFKNKVVQYFTDDMGDYYGQRSTLYQDMAKEIFGEGEGIFFCTDVPEKN